MRSLTRVALAAAAAVPFLVAVQARADFYDANVITNPTGGSLPVSGLTFSVDKFDSSLGTLTEVDVSLDGTYSNGAILFNNSTGSPLGYSNEGLNVQAVASFPAGFNVLLTITANSGPYNGTIPGGTTSPSAYDITGLSGSGSTTQSTTSNLSNYLSYPGTITVGLSASGVLTGSAETPMFTGSAADMSANLHVRYYYDPIPEPASLGVLGLGALALLARRRRA